jgi:NAD(P)-dependent dehydrogenase (short-subunit alcohol dehydrogenase family)
MCTYSATKAATLALTRCTAIDCGAYGIRVNAICPGPILTDATKRHADSQVKEGGREGGRKGGREKGEVDALPLT